MKILFFLFISLYCFGQSIIVETGTYTGDATNPRTITTTNSLVQDGKAVVVFVKSHNTNYDILRTDDMPVDSSISLWPAQTWTADAIISFSASGFVVNSYLNANTIAHYWMAIIADTTLMTTRTYTGSGGNATLTLPFTPGFALWKTKSASAQGAWKSYKMGTDTLIHVSGTYAPGHLQAGGFSGNTILLANGALTNASGKVYYMFAIKNDANFLSALKYTGTGSAHTVNFDRAIPSITVFSIFTSGNSTNIPAAWKTDDMATNVIMRITNNGLFNGYENVTVSSVDVNTSVITNTNTRKYEGWIVTSYTTPAVEEESASGKFKGNDYFDRFKKQNSPSISKQ